jgi:hypothetical protein
MLLGYDRETWRTIVVVTVATIAVGGVVVAYLTKDRPEEVTCGELPAESLKRSLFAEEVARDLAVPGQSDERVAQVVEDEIYEACALRGPSHRPVNSDLRGTVRQRLEASRRDR